MLTIKNSIGVPLPGGLYFGVAGDISLLNTHNLKLFVMAVNIAQASALGKAAAQDKQVLRQVWDNIKPDSCPQSYNFHMHTNCSDGQLQPEELIKQAVEIGLKGLAITDHHTIRGYQAAQNCLVDWRKMSPAIPLPHLWTGVEITAVLLGIEVHILGYAFDPQHQGLKPYLQGNTPDIEHAQAAKVISAIHQAGGLAVLAHPVRYRRSAQELVPVAAQLGIDGLEVYYSYNNSKPWRTSPRQTQEVKHLSLTYNLLSSCGTDTHGLNLLLRM